MILAPIITLSSPWLHGADNCRGWAQPGNSDSSGIPNAGHSGTFLCVSLRLLSFCHTTRKIKPTLTIASSWVGEQQLCAHPVFFHVDTESGVEVERASASFSSKHHWPELWEQRQKEAWALRRWQLVTILHSNIVPESVAICQPVWFKIYTRVFSSVWRVNYSVNVIYI